MMTMSAIACHPGKRRKSGALRQTGAAEIAQPRVTAGENGACKDAGERRSHYTLRPESKLTYLSQTDPAVRS
jgi:hypothetical protein